MGTSTKLLREKFRMTQKELADRYNIPLRTVQNWDLRNCMPDYVFIAIYKSESYMEDYFELRKCIRKNLEFGIEMFGLPEGFYD